MVRDQLMSIGHELYERGLQTTRSGNISARNGDAFVITKTGSNLGYLTLADFVLVGLEADATIPDQASCEAPVHKAIYNASGACAVVHAHPPYPIALAHMTKAEGITPLHNEGLVGLKWIPVIDTSVEGREGGEEPCRIALQLAAWCSVVIRGHGAFTVGGSPSEALYRMFLLDDVCRILAITRTSRRDRERRRPSASSPRQSITTA